MATDNDSGASPTSALSESGCPFLSRFDRFDATPDLSADLKKERFKARAGLAREWLLHRPAELFAELRKHRPVLVTGGPIPVVVTTAEEVKRVLSENKAFPVEPYQNPINTNAPPKGLGHFLLADLDLERHDREKEVFSDAMRVDPAFFRGSVRAHADDLIRLVREHDDYPAPKFAWREIDVVKDVAARLPIRVLGFYFGIPTGGPGRMPEACMYLLVARLFRGLFMNFDHESSVQAEALESSAILWEYVEAERRARRPQVLASRDQPVDLLGKFIWLRERGYAAEREVFSSDERVVANLCGIVTGAVVGFVQALAFIVDVLDEKGKDVWNGAIEAAARDDMPKLWAYAQEALRFRPQGIGIVRESKGSNSLRDVAIPEGSLVLASHQSAMMDEALVPEPERFRLDRPPEQYLHFGVARNRCLGIELAPIIITEALRAILTLKNVRSLPNKKLQMGHPYPESLILAYDP